MTVVRIKKEKLKLSLCRAGQAPRVPGSQLSAHEGDKVVSPAHRPLLPPPHEIFLVLISVRG